MSHRSFRDGGGTSWDVWSVVPTKVERRVSDASGSALPHDRRKHTEYRVALGAQLADGWLCFESSAEKRRLAPYPSRWELLTDAELSRLLEAAKRVGKPRRLAE